MQIKQRAESNPRSSFSVIFSSYVFLRLLGMLNRSTASRSKPLKPNVFQTSEIFSLGEGSTVQISYFMS